MKNSTLICKATIAIFLSLLFLGACNQKEETNTPTIRLKSPAAEETFDLNDGNVRFEWQVTGVIPGGYTVVLATDPSMIDVKTYNTPPTAFSKELYAEDLDIVLKNWGYKANELALVYWKVEATEDEVDEEGLRPVNIRRLSAEAVEIALITPARNALIDLGAANSLKFEWAENSDIEAYSFEFSQQEDGDKLAVSVGVDLNTISGNSVTISSTGLTGMIESLGLTAPVTTFFWKVRSKTSSAPGASESRRVRLIKIGAEGLSPVENLTAIPGNKRAKLTWDVGDPRIRKVTITWNGGSKTMDVSSDDFTMDTIIEPLGEGSYTFTVVCQDELENSSDPATADANVYGDAFAAGLKNRSMELSSLTRDGVMITIPKIDNSYLLYSDLIYTDGSGQVVSVRIGNDETEKFFALGAITLGTAVTIESTYAPQPIVLDPVVPSDVSRLYVPDYSLMNKTLHEKVANVAHDHGFTAGFEYSFMFDGLMLVANNMWHTAANSENASGTNNSLVGSPIMCTIDLGEVANISSFVIWGRYGGIPGALIQDGGTGPGGSYFSYGSYNPRKFAIWGSNTAPANVTDADIWKADGTWLNTWTKLAECEIVRPSGCPVTSYRDEDLTLHPCAFPPDDQDMLAANAGFEFTIPLDMPAMRYIRLVVTENWDFNIRKRISIAEMSFYKYIPEE